MRRNRRLAAALAFVAASTAVGVTSAGPSALAAPVYVAEDLIPGSDVSGSWTNRINDAGDVLVLEQSQLDGITRTYRWTEADGLRDIGDIGASPTIGRDMNQSGQIVGSGGFSSSSPYNHAFSWTPTGGIVDLGTFGGPESNATAVNDAGVVVGTASVPDGSNRAFMWSGGALQDIGVPGHAGGAIDINNAGEVIVRDFVTGAVYLRSPGGSMTDIGNLGGGTFVLATDLNDAGVVVGGSYAPSGDLHPFLWTAAGGMVDLGSLGGSFAMAVAVNEQGEVAGRATTAGDNTEESFYWSSATGIVQIPGIGGDESNPSAINELGQVVGYSAPPSGDEHAYVWSLADGYTDLGFLEAVDINESGTVVGSRENPDQSQQRAARWTSFVDPDADGDGIEDVIDTGAGSFSDGTSYGSITSAAGLSVTVSDAPAPAGVTISGSGSGGPALVSACGFSLSIAAGSTVTVTCGSVRLQVLAGSAQVVLSGGSIVVDVPSGATARVTAAGADTWLVEDLAGTGDVTVTEGSGGPVTVPPAGLGVPQPTATDTTPPAVACPAAPTFVLAQPSTTLTAVVTDETAPLSSTVTVPAPTTAVGARSVSVTGTDAAGNSTTVTCGYSVSFRFTGFSAPIDNLPTVNTAKAGQTIPVKWRLSDWYGVGVADPAGFIAVTTSTGSCGAGAPFDAVETCTGNSGLQYLGNGNWQFNWKTPKSYAGLCRTMHLVLADGGTVGRSAAFKFN